MAAPPAAFGRKPLWALVLLSPVLAEMLSGSSPPTEWLNPFGALLLIWLYGSGVVVMRETAVRWRLGWAGLVALGAAYGIIEEGLAVKSFFDPAWMDLGTLGSYGRFLDTNWVWALWLTIYHAIFSIALPIFLIEWAYPSIRGKPLLAEREYALSLASLLGATLFLNALLTGYRPSAAHLAGAALAVVGLAWFAKDHADRIWSRLPRGRPPSRAACAIVGFAFPMASFLVYGGGPFLGWIPAVTYLEGAALLLGAALVARRITGDPALARHRFAMAAGAVSFLIALASFLELAGNRGMGAVAAAFTIWLVVLHRRRIPEDGLVMLRTPDAAGGP